MAKCIKVGKLKGTKGVETKPNQTKSNQTKELKLLHGCTQFESKNGSIKYN